MASAARAASTAPAPAATEPSPWADVRSFWSYARAHVACLEAGGGFKAATALAGTLRRRFRPLRDAPAPAQALAAAAFAAAGRALAVGVVGLEGVALAGVATEKAALAQPPSGDDERADAGAARAAGVATAEAAGFSAETGWALLSGIATLRRQGCWTHADGDAGVAFEAGPGAVAPHAPTSQQDLDTLLVRGYTAYTSLRLGLAAGDPPRRASQADAMAGVEHLGRTAKRGGGPPVPVL